MKYILIMVFILIVSCGEKKVKKDQKTMVITEYKGVLSSGKIDRIKQFPSNNIVPRTVDVWLPKNYSKEKKYAVVYMHDGQNLFDETSTWNQQEWKVDEISTKLMNKGLVKPFIVVGIHSIAKSRFFDLYPKKALNYIPKKSLNSIFTIAEQNNHKMSLELFNGDAYLKFIVEEVKPYVDKTYAVETNRENTFVAGSSMGGLMSMYAICEYPDVFSGAACLSTHWIGMKWDKENTNLISNGFFRYIKDNMPAAKTHKFYFDFGTKSLDQYYVQFEDQVNVLFQSKGYTNENFQNLKFEGADHTELSWQKRFDIPLTFLLKK
ncbi:alpha/beta hydrolase-fold protein [Flavicella sp.]|uniref:alpha/beta hydrolase n=1 Tax=Flavicella sp. TaxID=2957742 RepID=UPI0030190566